MLVFTFLLSLLLILQCQGENRTWAEGSNWKLQTFSSQSVERYLALNLVLEEEETSRICMCTIDGTCSNYMPSNFGVSLRITEDKGTKTFNLTATYMNVTRTKNKFQFVRDGLIIVRREYYIYVKTSKARCYEPTLIPTGQYISLTCVTERVYPEARCDFKSTTYPSNLTFPVTYESRPSPIQSNDFTTECNTHIPVQGLDPGSYQFSAITFPDVPGGREIAPVASYLSPVIRLSIPTAAIAEKCPRGSHVKDGEILQGSTATCICELKDVGYPAGYAQWYSEDGQAVGTTNSDRSSTLRLRYDPKDPNPTFRCQVESILNMGVLKSYHTFTPTYVEEFLSNNDQDGDNSQESLLIGVGIGLACATVLVISLAAVYYVMIHRRRAPATQCTPTAPANPTATADRLRRHPELVNYDAPVFNTETAVVRNGGSSLDMVSGGNEGLPRRSEVVNYDAPVFNTESEANGDRSFYSTPIPSPRVINYNTPSVSMGYLSIISDESDVDLNSVNARMSNRVQSAIDNDYLDPIDVEYTAEDNGH